MQRERIEMKCKWQWDYIFVSSLLFVENEVI